MTNIFEFFRQLEADHWSGTIEVTSSQGNCTLVLDGGKLLWAHRPLSRSAERFSRLSWIKVPDEYMLKQLRNWPDFMRELLGQNPRERLRIIHLLRTDRLEVFFRTVFWTNVEFTSRPHTIELMNPDRFSFLAPRSLSSLIQEAEERLNEWPEIQRRLGNSKRIFVSQVLLPNERRELDEIEKTLQEFDESQQKPPLEGLPYSFAEIEILRLCDGRNTVQDIVRMASDGEFLTLRRILALWDKTAIRPKEEASSITFVGRTQSLPWLTPSSIALGQHGQCLSLHLFYLCIYFRTLRHQMEFFESNESNRHCLCIVSKTESIRSLLEIFLKYFTFDPMNGTDLDIA